MNYEESLSVINQALNAATKAGVFTLKDSENIVLALYKINEAIIIAQAESFKQSDEMSLKQVGENSFVGGKVVEVSKSK